LQKILIIAESQVSRSFLEKIASEHQYECKYDIVYTDASILPQQAESFATLHNFDPTSEHKLRRLIDTELSQVYVMLDRDDEAKIVIEIIRSLNDIVQIISLRGQHCCFDAEKLKVKTISVDETISSMLVNFLPTVPLVASNIGLGVGEIMEVLVPYGSKYVFRHISNIEQKNWKVAAIYRDNKLVLPKPSTMIFPNDELLLVGKPEILRDVYKSIKSELGQFPQPFGSNIYLLADVQKIGLAKLKYLIGEMLYLSGKLKNKKLVIKAINQTDTAQGDYLRSIASDDVIVDMDYFERNIKETIKNDLKRYNIGLIAIGTKEFMHNGMRKALYETKKPILKLSDKSMKDATESVILLDGNYAEEISNIYFDFTAQLGCMLSIADFDPDGKEKPELYEHFTNLANIYSKKIEIKREAKNPYRELKRRENFIQFLSFEESMTKSSVFDFFRPGSQPLFRLLKEYTQVFIPISE